MWLSRVMLGFVAAGLVLGLLRGAAQEHPPAFILPEEFEGRVVAADVVRTSQGPVALRLRGRQGAKVSAQVDADDVEAAAGEAPCEILMRFPKGDVVAEEDDLDALIEHASFLKERRQRRARPGGVANGTRKKRQPVIA